MCKPWKVNGFRTERTDGERFSDHRRRVAADVAVRLAPRRIREFAWPRSGEGVDMRGPAVEIVVSYLTERGAEASTLFAPSGADTW